MRPSVRVFAPDGAKSNSCCFRWPPPAQRLTVTALAGCATMESASQESLLTSAGFQARTPSRPEQKSVYAALLAYQLGRGTKAGKPTQYVYKDEKAGVVYIGNEAQYQQYKQAAAEAELRASEQQLRHQQIAQALQQQQISNQLNSIELSQKLMAIRQMQPRPQCHNSIGRYTRKRHLS
jgi:hypothetical protein